MTVALRVCSCYPPVSCWDLHTGPKPTRHPKAKMPWQTVAEVGREERDRKRRKNEKWEKEEHETGTETGR